MSTKAATTRGDALPKNDGSVAEQLEETIEQRPDGDPVKGELAADKARAAPAKKGGKKSVDDWAAELLPTEFTEIEADLAKYLILLYGVPKVGKSTLASHFPDAVFLKTEEGTKSLRVRQMPKDKPMVTSWTEFQTCLAVLAKVDHPFKTIVVDTVDGLYKLCAEHTCTKHKIGHLSDLPNNAGYSFCNAEFERVIRRMTGLDLGVILISHSQVKENKRTGGERYEPSMTGSCNRIVTGLSDIILFASMHEIPDPENPAETKTIRALRTKPSPSFVAGDRTHALPDAVPLMRGRKGYEHLRDLFEQGMKARLEAEAEG